MPSINRSTFVTPVQRGVQPGGYGMTATGSNFQGPQGIVEFDNITGLQRRVGKRPLYTDLVRQGCRPTGRRTGPPGFESDEYDCPFPIAGSPAWYQGGGASKTVFDGLGNVAAGAAMGGFALLAVGLFIAWLVWPSEEY